MPERATAVAACGDGFGIFAAAVEALELDCEGSGAPTGKEAF
jgi:hypothetical protein